MPQKVNYNMGTNARSRLSVEFMTVPGRSKVSGLDKAKLA
jgi:hypothetical protein